MCSPVRTHFRTGQRAWSISPKCPPSTSWLCPGYTRRQPSEYTFCVMVTERVSINNTPSLPIAARLVGVILGELVRVCELFAILALSHFAFEESLSPGREPSRFKLVTTWPCTTPHNPVLPRVHDLPTSAHVRQVAQAHALPWLRLSRLSRLLPFSLCVPAGSAGDRLLSVDGAGAGDRLEGLSTEPFLIFYILRERKKERERERERDGREIIKKHCP